VETIENTTEESIRVREENRVEEVTKGQKRGILLLEEAKITMQILGEDPTLNLLIGPLINTPTNTNDEEKINNSKTIPLEESVD
jgi:hypothetical protein